MGPLLVFLDQCSLLLKHEILKKLVTYILWTPLLNYLFFTFNSSHTIAFSLKIFDVQFLSINFFHFIFEAWLLQLISFATKLLPLNFSLYVIRQYYNFDAQFNHLAAYLDRDQAYYNGILRHSFRWEGAVIFLQHIVPLIWSKCQYCTPDIGGRQLQGVLIKEGAQYAAKKANSAWSCLKPV